MKNDIKTFWRKSTVKYCNEFPRQQIGEKIPWYFLFMKMKRQWISLSVYVHAKCKSIYDCVNCDCVWISQVFFSTSFLDHTNTFKKCTTSQWVEIIYEGAFMFPTPTSVHEKVIFPKIKTICFPFLTRWRYFSAIV